jgi:hypothetical protein
MTPETLSSFAGILLSLLFSYVPGFEPWYAKLDGTYKRLVMLAALVLVTGTVFALGCANLVEGIACTQKGVIQFLQMLVFALIANQSTYLISPEKPSNAHNG